MTLADLLKTVPADADYRLIDLVFTDDFTEYAYGVRCKSVGVDNVALTWDVDKCYFVPEVGGDLKEML